MNHDVYENQMIDSINRHAEEQSQYTGAPAKNRLVNKKNARTLGRGISRMLFALLTAVLFAISVYGFIVVASVTGYWAVLLFNVSIVNLFWACVLVYTQGRARKTDTESQGDDK